MIIEDNSEGEKFESYQNHRDVVMNKFNQADINSLVIRDPVINGRIDTINESINSKGLIQSFKSMSTPKKKQDGIKRESILKFVLLQNSKGNSENMYGNKFYHEYFDTEFEQEEYEF